MRHPWKIDDNKKNRLEYKRETRYRPEIGIIFFYLATWVYSILENG